MNAVVWSDPLQCCCGAESIGARDFESFLANRRAFIIAHSSCELPERGETLDALVAGEPVVCVDIGRGDYYGVRRAKPDEPVDARAETDLDAGDVVEIWLIAARVRRVR